MSELDFKNEQRANIMGVGFSPVDMNEAVRRAMELIAQRSRGWVVTPNPEIVMIARENADMADAAEKAALVLADGIGVIYAAKILGKPLPAKVPGCDFAQNVMAELAKKSGSVFLFGAKPGVAELAAENLQKQFPGLVIAGVNDGYFKDDGPIIEKINAAKPDFLLVCLGAPKQEIWMRDHSAQLDVGLMAGLGGSLDVFAGVVQRAPVRWQKLGLEWLYRLLKEPKRIGRMAKLPLFLVQAALLRVKGR